MSPLRYSGPVR